MAIEFLKKAVKTPQSGEEETVRIVQEMPVSYTHLTLPTIYSV